MIFTAVKSYKIAQCHRKMPVTNDSIRNYDGCDADATMRNKSSVAGGRLNTLILVVSVVTFLLAFGSRATNAEPTAPAQVAAAVAAATGTDEKVVGQSVMVAESPSSATDRVDQSHGTALSPAPQSPQETVAITTGYSSGSQTSTTGSQPQLPDGVDGGSSDGYRKQPQISGNILQQDEEQRQQQLLLAPLLMPSTSMSAEWPSQLQSTSVDGISVVPSHSSVVGRERTVMEIVPVPSASEQHLVDSVLLHPSQPEYNYLPSGSSQSESELQQPDPEPQQSKQTEASELLQIPQQQLHQTNVPSDQQQYSYYYGNNNNVVTNLNNDDDQQQQHSNHYYYQQNLVQHHQRQLNINNNNNNNININAAAAYSPLPLQYGFGQFHYYNNFGAVGKYPPQQQQQQLQQSHHYRARDGGRPLTRRNSRSQQQPAYDNNGGGGNFYHYAPLQLHPQPQKPSPDHGGESDNVIGIKYDQDQTVGGAAGKHQPVPPFRPSHPVWASQYPVPWTYYVKSSMVQPGRPAMPYPQHNYFNGRKSRYVLQQPGGAASNRIGYSAAKPPRTKVVYIEYGGFKPKMVPSVQITTAEDFDHNNNNNNNRRQSAVDDGDDETVGTAARPMDGGGDAAAQEGASHRDRTPAAPVTVNATTATVTTIAATTTTSSTTASTSSASPPSPSPPSQPRQQQQQPTEPEQLHPPAAAGVVVVVV